MEIRPATAQDQEPLFVLLDRIESFSPDEIRSARAAIAASCKQGSQDYQILLGLSDGRVVGYVCYGPIALTEGTFDLYWIASDPDVRGQGVGASLVGAMEADIRRRNGRLIRIETSATEDYGPARGFYQSMQYREEARFRDFYKPGDDLVILKKAL
jgi:ribosomal protein S18 acetylase RimI-like enzyme